MPQFSYRARNAQGGLVEGVLNVADRAVAIQQIEQQDCVPIRIEAIATGPQVLDGKAVAAAAPPTQNLKIPHGQLLIFTEQLGHLLQAGMTLDESLGVLEKRLKHPRVQQMTHALHQALVDGRPLAVTTTELAILELLLRRTPAVVTRQSIALNVWPVEADGIGSNTIDVHLARLRAKLSGSRSRIETVRGVGYRLLAS